MKKQLFVDLDKTLFDTDKFKKRLWAEIGKKYNFDGEAARVLNFDDKIVEGHYLYGFERHLRAFIPDASQLQIMEEVRPSLQGDDYLFKDATECLKWQAPDREVKILTFGQEPFQHFKFSFCEALHSLPFFVVNKPKREYINQNYTGVGGWLIDDKPNQNLPVGFTEIWLKRDNLKDVERNDDIIIVNSLKKILEVL